MGKLLTDLDFSQYREADAINFSRLKLMDISPRHFRANVHRDRPWLSMGRKTHTFILEADKFWDQYAVYDGRLDARTKAFKAWAEEHPGAEPVKPQEMDELRAIFTSVHSHPFMHEVLAAPGHREVTLFWDEGMRKARLDLVIPGRCIIDLKTTSSIHPRSFGINAAKYHYHAQAAWYVDAWEAVKGEELPFYLCAVESSEPYDCAVYEVDPEQIRAGRRKYQSWLDMLGECERSSSWPGVASEVTPLALPEWCLEQDAPMALSIGGESYAL